MLTAGKPDDVVHSQKVRLVSQVRDEFQFILNLLLNVVRNTSGKSPLRADPGFLSQISRRREAVWNEFVGIFVPQLVERECAATGNVHRLGKRVTRIEVGQSQP